MLEERKEKGLHRGLEEAKEAEVQAAYESLETAIKEGKTLPIDSLVNKSFNLYCSDHVDHFYSSDYYPTKRLDFYRNDDEDDPHLGDSKLDKTDMLYGTVYLNADACLFFGPFRPPECATGEAVKVDNCGPYELSLMFLGNDYLKLSVSKNMVFKRFHDEDPPFPSPPIAPEVFEFVGIWSDSEKEQAERRETRSERRSPRETWFELNHPMGFYRSGW